MEYGPGLCPNAEQMMQEIVATGINEFYSEDDIRDMATAIRKVAASAQKG